MKIRRNGSLDKSTKNVFILSETEKNPDTPYHWDDMPEFKTQENQPYKQIRVNFESEKDIEEFSKLIDQTVTNKTKAIRFPKRDKSRNSLLRWMDEDDPYPNGELK